MLGLLTKWRGQGAVMPPPSVEIVSLISDQPEMIVAEPIGAARPQPISAFTCIIDYKGESRMIVCRRYDLIGELGYVGAICSTAESYRQFRCDRITTVSDAYTGEVLGDGSFFARFEVTSRREKAPTWGLSPARKAVLVAGLNVLAFMARCDGRWHQMETEAIERFICSMWIRKEWEGDAPIDEILAHATRLAPDSDTFFSALDHYARSRSSAQILKRAVSELVAADGVICAAEHAWVSEINDYLDDRARSEGNEEIEQWVVRELG